MQHGTLPPVALRGGAPAPCGPAPVRLLGPRGRRPKPGPCACASRERGAARPARWGEGDERRAAGRWPLAAGGQGGGRHPAAAKADGDSARHGGIGVTPVCRKMAGIWILGRVWLRGPCVAESFRLKVRLLWKACCGTVSFFDNFVVSFYPCNYCVLLVCFTYVQ